MGKKNLLDEILPNYEDEDVVSSIFIEGKNVLDLEKQAVEKIKSKRLTITEKRLIN